MTAETAAVRTLLSSRPIAKGPRQRVGWGTSDARVGDRVEVCYVGGDYNDYRTGVVKTRFLHGSIEVRYDGPMRRERRR
jgi:hypothetical protein